MNKVEIGFSYRNGKGKWIKIDSYNPLGHKLNYLGITEQNYIRFYNEDGTFDAFPKPSRARRAREALDLTTKSFIDRVDTNHKEKRCWTNEHQYVHRNGNGWCVRRISREKSVNKSFRTIEEALAYRDFLFAQEEL